VPEKPLTELTDQELQNALSSHVNRGVAFNYNDVRNELERRRQQKNADRVFYLSIVAICISVASLVMSVLVALFK
jgi:hypothetical protein